jgi:tetratricopeptide (TPR) repeat protein
VKRSADAKRLLGKANRLDIEVGNTASDVPRDGYVAAMEGYVDSARQAKAIAAFEELVATFPDEEYFRYLKAGSLMRSAKYRDAEDLYLTIANGSGHYKLPAHLMLVIVYWHLEGSARAQQALDRHNHLAKELGQPVHHSNASDMFAV